MTLDLDGLSTVFEGSHDPIARINGLRLLAALEEARRERAQTQDDADKYRLQMGEADAEVEELRDELASSRAEVERLRDELRDKRTDLLNVRGILSPNGFEPVTPLSLVPDVAPAVAWLVAERERMRPVVEAAKTWRWRSATHPTTPYLDATRLEAAVDTYESQGATDG